MVDPSGRTAPDDSSVSTIELFFDLVFVFAVTRTSELLQDDHSWTGVLRALVVFVPVFWQWVGTTMYADLTDVDGAPGRFTFFGIALSGLVMALALPEAYTTAAWVFAAAYWAGRLILWFAVLGHPHRREFVTFPVGAVLTGPLFLAGAACPPGSRLAVWGVAAVVELVTPFARRRALTGTPFRTGHLADRYATFVIIALGESVVAIGVAAAGADLGPVELWAVALGFAVCAALWWMYFDLAAPAIEHGLARARVPIEIIRPVLSYGHLAFVAGIIGIAAGIGASIGEPGRHLAPDASALLFGGAAVFLATFGFTRWRLLRTIAYPRLAGALACAILAVAAPAIPALSALAALLAVLVAVNLADHLRAHRAGR